METVSVGLGHIGRYTRAEVGCRKEWQKWAAFIFSSLYAVPTFLMWSIIPINIAGRTKKSFMSATVFVVSRVALEYLSNTRLIPRSPRSHIAWVIWSALRSSSLVTRPGISTAWYVIPVARLPRSSPQR